jgi:5-methylcytosine-specific restriction endonuclease McrA
LAPEFDEYSDRELALPDSDEDSDCRRCGARIRGSGAAEPSTRKESHIAHFETRHLKGSKQRDRRAYNRALEYDVEEVELVSEIEVFRRDHYTCQLCGKGLILNERSNHPKGPSIDHIVWLSRGGSHTFGNCRAAHLGCNRREGLPYKATARAPGEANRARRAREQRKRRSRAARERYRRRQNREVLSGCLMVIVLLDLVVLIARC